LIQENSHKIKDGISPITYTVRNTVNYSGGSYRQSDQRGAVNRFDDVSAMFTDRPASGMILNFSRADFAGTFPTAPTPADRIANADVLRALGAYDVQAANRAPVEMPITGAQNGLSLIDLRGLDYDDQLWDLLLDQLTVENMLTVILNGAYHTEPLPTIGKPATVDLDGPAGFTSFMGSVNSTAYPSAVVIASSFSKQLAREWGVMLGNDALANNINGWYAPGINLHRSPFAGRNFEYYSEDPLHSGIIAAEVISGAQSKGVVTYLKHYALNDQETNRVANGVATWANEQAIREIYLKAFEIPAKQVNSSVTFYSGDNRTTRDIGLTGMMSSFNRIGAVWAGGSYPLMTEVLRDEWGFRGSVITDFNLFGYMFPDQAVRAGTDFMLTFTPMKSMEDSTSAAAVANLRKSMHNVLYAVANSNAMNGIAPGSTIIVHMATWRIIQIIINIVIGLLLILAAVLVIRKAKRG
jgi:beta-glucosidase